MLSKEIDREYAHLSEEQRRIIKAGVAANLSIVEGRDSFSISDLDKPKNTKNKLKITGTKSESKSTKKFTITTKHK